MAHDGPLMVVMMADTPPSHCALRLFSVHALGLFDLGRKNGPKAIFCHHNFHSPPPSIGHYKPSPPPHNGDGLQ